MHEKIADRSKERLKIDNKDINKLSGLEYLAKNFIPVPRIFYSWEEAEPFVKNGKTVLGRTFVTDSRDNDLIDVFPTYKITSGEQFKRIKETAKKIASGEDIKRYAAQFKLSDDQIQTEGFLQEMVGIPNVNAINIITMDIGNGNVLVQFRNTRGKTTGRFFSAKEIEMLKEEDLFSKIKFGYEQNPDFFYNRAILIHKKSKSLLSKGWNYQFEMAGSFDLKDYQGYLGVVQVKPTVESRKVSFNKEANLGKALSKLKRRLKNKTIKIISTDFSIARGDEKDIYSLFGLSEDEPYILQIDQLPSPRGLLKTGFKYGNIVGIVFTDKRAFSSCLQHDTNKLMKLVWLNGGQIFFVE